MIIDIKYSTGTGKTVTIVEAIRQIIAKEPNARILACAPSNSAADTIAERLSALGNESLIRLVAPSCAKSSISKAVLNFTRTYRRNKRDVFFCPPREELENFSVIVSTCGNASVPYEIGVQPDHFTHVFVDEATQAKEPEVMIPIMAALGPRTNVILSGDIKQRVPTVCFAVARELGLKVSLLERLMSTSLYNEDIAKEKLSVNLIVVLVKYNANHEHSLLFQNGRTDEELLISQVVHASLFS